jgi:hypothetical protein
MSYDSQGKKYNIFDINNLTSNIAHSMANKLNIDQNMYGGTSSNSQNYNNFSYKHLTNSNNSIKNNNVIEDTINSYERIPIKSEYNSSKKMAFDAQSVKESMKRIINSNNDYKPSLLFNDFEKYRKCSLNRTADVTNPAESTFFKLDNTFDSCFEARFHFFQRYF